jgi:hypothetical protein
MRSLGYLLVLVLLPESFYLEKVMVLGGECHKCGLEGENKLGALLNKGEISHERVND